MKAKVNGKQKKTRQGLGKVLRKKQHRRREEVSNLLGRFGRYVTRRREEKQMSIREFAKAMGMPFSNIFQLEQLRKNPRLTELEQLARGLGEPLITFLNPVLEPERSESDPPVSIV